MNLKPFILLLVALTGLAGCDRKPASENLSIIFAEQEEGAEPVQTRVLVTADYLRFDDGKGAEDFILFDRNQKVIYSVSRESRQIIEIADSNINVKSPIELKLTEAKLDDMKEFPTINGIKPQHYTFSSGEEMCYETLSAKGLLPAYVKAVKEFNNILAKDSMVTLTSMPADMQNGCDLAKHTYAPNRHFVHGFPLRIWKGDSYSATLVDFKENYQADKLLFELPADYRRLRINDLRSSFAESGGGL